MVSTVGLLSGVATAGVAESTILLTGVVLLSVEAFSMAVGSFLSERSAEEYEDHHEVSPKYSIIGGVVMLFTYIIVGIIPLLPYALLEVNKAFWFSVVLSLLALFMLGVVTAKVVRVKIFWNGLRTFLFGGTAILVGIFIGGLIK